MFESKQPKPTCCFRHTAKITYACRRSTPDEVYAGLLMRNIYTQLPRVIAERNSAMDGQSFGQNQWHFCWHAYPLNKNFEYTQIDLVQTWQNKKQKTKKSTSRIYCDKLFWYQSSICSIFSLKSLSQIIFHGSSKCWKWRCSMWSRYGKL